jgi:hypothetical protein
MVLSRTGFMYKELLCDCHCQRAPSPFKISTMQWLIDVSSVLEYLVCAPLSSHCWGSSRDEEDM